MKGRLVALATLCLLAWGMRGTARAGVTDDLAVWLDRDAAVVIRTEPLQIERGAGLAVQLGVPGASEAVRLSRLAGQSGLGADLLTRKGWHQAGFDANAPVLIGLAAVNASAMARALASTRAGRTMATPIWRSRIALRVSNGSRVESLVKRVARLAPSLSGVSTVETPLIARLLGATVMQSMRLAADLKRRGVIAVGYVPEIQSVVFVMRRKRTLLIDILGTFDGKRPRWSRMRSRLLSVLDRGAGRFHKRMPDGAAVELRKPGNTIWIDAVRFYDAIAAHRGATLMARFNAGVARRDQLQPLPKACSDFRKVATAGPFRDFAFRSVLKHKHVVSESTWGMRTLFKMSAPFLVQNDQLPLPKVSSSGPLASGALFVRGLGHLRSVPRPPALQTTFVTMWRDAGLCGAGAVSAVALYGWPQAIGLFLDDLAKIHPDANTLVTGLRNGVFAVRKLSWQLKGLQVTVAATGSKAAIPVAKRMLTTVFGTPMPQSAKGGPTATWGTGPMRPFAFDTVLGKPALGISAPPSGIAPYLTAKPVPHQSRRAIVGRFDLDLARALPHLAPGYTGRHLATKLTLLKSTLEITPETIVLSTRVSLSP